MRWWWQKELPEPVRSYREGTPRRVPAPTPLDELKLVVIDSECTGFDIAKDRMLSLALIEVNQGQIQLTKAASWMLFQAGSPMTSAVSVHGILPAETAEGQKEISVLQELLPRLTGAVIVGHHIGFDLAMINAAMKRHYKTTLCNPAVDTGKLAMLALDAFAKTGYPGQRDPGLDEVCAQCGVVPFARHTAEGDAYTTAELFLVLCAHLRRRKKRDLQAKDLPLS